MKESKYKALIINLLEMADEKGLVRLYYLILGFIGGETEEERETPTDWIPVESATPDDLQEVLATDGKYVYLVEYDSDYGYGDLDGITAWMPLPEPYEAVKRF